MAQSSSSTDPLPHDCPADTVEFLRGLRDLQSRGILCDVELKGSDCEESSKGIACHRNVVAVHSAYFSSAFTHDWKESAQPVIQLRDIDCRTLNELVTYAYTMDLHLNHDNVESILIGAQFLQMTLVASICWEFVEKRLCLSNCLPVHALASQHHNPVLAGAALALIIPNFLCVAQTHEFLQMDAQQLIVLIALDEVEVFSEDQVLEAVLLWLNYDRPGRLAHVPAVLQNVRTSFLSAESRKVYSATLISAGAPCEAAMVDLEVPAAKKQKTAPRHSCGAHEVIVCVGGHDSDGSAVEIFSPSLPAVWCLEELPFLDDCCRAVLLDASTIFISHAEGPHIVKRDSHYMGLRNECLKVAPMLTPRRLEGLVALNGRVYSAGGYSTRGPHPPPPLTSMEAYNPESNSWSAVAPLPNALVRPVMVACDGRFYVFGGIIAGGGRSKCAFSYDPAADTWTRLSDMPTARSDCVGCVAPSGLIFVIGGKAAEGYSRRVDAYDCAADQWLIWSDTARIPDALAWMGKSMFLEGMHSGKGTVTAASRCTTKRPTAGPCTRVNCKWTSLALAV
ncbi:kelch-like protein 3 isoform X2 [Paramacrobiotus metropolitanus]|uniref:kelch-like protein 3 isoform X2 n=1 Tax=Paramacrobiotus metropolitanus TaxID=2943436 RepID=UPI002445776B|nr:kelch-like protein 3 isoform X2 [Paramacrobiotus metropolitanus]